MAASTGSEALDRMVERLGERPTPGAATSTCSGWPSAPLPVEQQTDDLRVRGCVSQVFVRGELQQGVMRWQGDSDALITKGLLAFLIEGLNGLTPRQVSAIDPGFIEATGLQASLTPSRANGFLNILRMMQTQAAALDSSGGPLIHKSQAESFNERIDRNGCTDRRRLARPRHGGWWGRFNPAVPAGTSSSCC